MTPQNLTAVRPIRSSGRIFQLRFIAVFVAFLLLLAYLEEGFWNVWGVARERPRTFLRSVSCSFG
jgi:hypothetical protein